MQHSVSLGTIMLWSMLQWWAGYEGEESYCLTRYDLKTFPQNIESVDSSDWLSRHLWFPAAVVVVGAPKVISSCPKWTSGGHGSQPPLKVKISNGKGCWITSGLVNSMNLSVYRRKILVTWPQDFLILFYSFSTNEGQEVAVLRCVCGGVSFRDFSLLQGSQVSSLQLPSLHYFPKVPVSRGVAHWHCHSPAGVWELQAGLSESARKKTGGGESSYL